MIFQLISLLFSLLYYAVILAVIVVVGFYLYLVVYLLRVANDFPNKRRMCTSKQKLQGKTAIVTGMDTILIIVAGSLESQLSHLLPGATVFVGLNRREPSVCELT